MAQQVQMEKDQVRLELRWPDPSDLPTVYANQVYVSHAGGEFYLVFGEVQQPMLHGWKPEQIRELGSLPVKPVVKLVLTPQGMKGILEVMTENMSRFEEQQARANQRKDE